MTRRRQDSYGTAPLAMEAATFRALGHQLVDQLAEALDGDCRTGRSRATESPSAVRAALDLTGPLPEAGTDPGALLRADGAAALRSLALQRASAVLRLHHLVAGADRHARRFSRRGAEPERRRVGRSSPAATEIEAQTVRWIAELIGYPTDCGGLLVSGGNMANLVCFLAARAAKADWDVRAHGLAGDGRRLRVYASAETHTWIQKAADLAGLGTDAIRWIPTDARPADGRRGAAPAARCGPRRRRRAVSRRRHGRIGQHGRGRSAAGDRRGLPGARRLVPRRRRVRRLRGGGAGGARRSARAEPSPIPSRWIRTSGSTRRSKPAARWCAIPKRCARRSPTIRRTTTSTSARRTTSTTVRRIRAASARSRSGSRCGRSAPPAIAR